MCRLTLVDQFPGGDDIEVIISPESERLQVLEPFAPVPNETFADLPVLEVVNAVHLVADLTLGLGEAKD